MTSFHPLDALRTAPGPKRPRRLRRTAALRDLVRETSLDPADLVYPLFVVPGDGVRRPVSSMPGVDQVSADELAAEARELAALGVKAVLLFGIPSAKDAQRHRELMRRTASSRARSARSRTRAPSSS